MEVVLLGLCDDIITAPETGRTNIIGVHDLIPCTAFPATVEFFRVAYRFRHIVPEKQWSVQWMLMEEDGARVALRAALGNENVFLNMCIVGQPPRYIEFCNVTFEKPGRYTLLAVVDDSEFTLPIDVQLPP